ncbi:hypothetical protein [Rickettsia asembonensis]|uniref:hypothetical protein n=1 Tax=Rickettsia asembonensis TaxID=1068590 RepID=UPI001F52AF39|nr:hypothetical protein [Rickettsia asembonensis]
MSWLTSIKPSLRAGVVAWISFTSVIPRLDREIQLKILKLLVFLLFFGYRGQATG